MADSKDKEITQKMVEWRKVIFEEMEKIINEQRDLIVTRAAARLQKQGIKVEKGE